MAKAYICDKCGKPFDYNDRYKENDEKWPSFPIILKYTDEMDVKKKYRDWYKKRYCSKCSHGIMRSLNKESE